MIGWLGMLLYQDAKDEEERLFKQENSDSYERLLLKYVEEQKKNVCLKSDLALAVEALEKFTDRGLDWDMVEQSSGMRLLQKRRGEAKEALKKLKGEKDG